VNVQSGGVIASSEQIPIPVRPTRNYTKTGRLILIPCLTRRKLLCRSRHRVADAQSASSPAPWGPLPFAVRSSRPRAYPPPSGWSVIRVPPGRRSPFSPSPLPPVRVSADLSPASCPPGVGGWVSGVVLPSDALSAPASPEPATSTPQKASVTLANSYLRATAIDFQCLPLKRSLPRGTDRIDAYPPLPTASCAARCNKPTSTARDRQTPCHRTGPGRASAQRDENRRGAGYHQRRTRGRAENQ
jgi:hypothetical protein